MLEERRKRLAAPGDDPEPYGAREGQATVTARKAENPASILAVDDNLGNLLTLSAILTDLNQEVVTVSSGREALRLLLHREFAVVLLDVHMPGLDGFETAALIRQRRSSEHTPIIFITSFPDETHAARGYSLGAVDYILAPVDPEVLKTKVMVFVELFKKTAQVTSQATALERRAVQLQRLTQASLAINSALSPDQMLQVITDLARDIIGVHQAVTVAAPDQKWLSPRSAIALSQRYDRIGERPVLRDRSALLSLLSAIDGPIRITRDRPTSSWESYLASDRPARLGWLAAPLTTRDGRKMGLLHLLEKCDEEFTEEDESVLTQLAQMSSVALENAVNAEAREANRMKDEFLTTLSHELRTPLSAILGWTRLLRSGHLDSKRGAHAVEVIERNVLAQAKLIDDLLDVSRIITGKLRLQIRRTLISAVIEAVMDAMRPAAEGKQIRMRFETHLPPRSDQILGDPDRLQQIVWNLISNAIKFTPNRGRVTVTLTRRNGQFEISVSDTGRGMTQEFLVHAFDRFRQADSSTTRLERGLGIGLAIARHLAEMHGGAISAESAGPGHGSRFVVLLPAAALGLEEAPRREPALVEAPALPHPGPSDLSGIRILLVEDEDDARDVLAEMLRASGAEVTSVASARQALETLPLERPDVLVSDIGMPEEDGYSLLRRLREWPEEQGGLTPAVAVSAYAREEDRIRSLSAGFQAHLAKPFEPADLMGTIRRLARRAESEPESSRALPEKAPHRILVIEDDPDSREGLRDLLQAWGHEVEVADAGPQGIERAVEKRPRIALIDIGLPGLDGYEVARSIRGRLTRDEILLVALTGYAGSEVHEKALANGFDAYLSKPLNYERLSSLLILGTSGR